MNIIYIIIIINNKYNKNRNMTKEFVWSSGYCFSGDWEDLASSHNSLDNSLTSSPRII